MIVKNGQIIAIGNVNTGGTLSGNGLAESPLGLSDDAIKLTPASTGIDIKKNVAEDGKIEYQLGISADITVESTIVEGGEGIKSEKIGDRTYKVSVSGDYLTSADNSLAGKNLVLKDNKWTVLSGSEVTPYSGGEGIKIENHIISVSSDYITSADDKFAGKSLVLKDNTWVPANEASGDIITTNTFNTYSSFVNNNFVTNSSFSSYSSYVDNSIYNLTNIASAYSSYSSYYSDNYNTVNNYSSYWNNHSALSATKLDKADSGLFMQVAKLEGTPDKKLSGYGGSAFYIPEIPGIHEYSGTDGIKIDDYWICISADYLSANALDNLSGNWNNVYGTVNDASARWDAHSALSAEIEKKLDASESVKFMKVAGLEYNEDKISGYAGSAFYVPTVHDYKGGNGIEITDNYIINISADYLSANALDNLSGNWNSVYGTVEAYSANWNNHSALSATKLDKADSGKFMLLPDIKGIDGKISGYGESAIYIPDPVAYSGKDGIKVDDYWIGISADYLSANALDNLSGNWDSTYETVGSYSANWNEASAFSANSGKFVTSGEEISDAGLAYVLKKTDNNVAWSGVDLSELGKIYPITSLTPDLVSATVSAIDGTQTYVLSAAAPEAVSINISGNNGVSASYNSSNDTWEIGLSADKLAYMYDTYRSNEAITGPFVIPFTGNNKHNITVDANGYISLPNTTNKFTFCINEYVEGNDTGSHDYLLNKISLSADTPEEIVSTQTYYPAEVGTSNATIAITLEHPSNRKYAVVYDGSDVKALAHLDVTISVLEEMIGLSEGDTAESKQYTGEDPIDVDNSSEKIKLKYDDEIFTLNDNNELTLNAGGDDPSPINPEEFNKLLNSINTRIVETLPIGTINYASTLSSGKGIAYLFRPMIEFEMNPSTVARIITGNAAAGQSKVMIAVYELNENNYTLNLMWWSEKKTLTVSQGEHIITANSAFTGTKTIYPHKLYYVHVMCFDQQIVNLLGIQNSITYDLGSYDLAYLSTVYNNHDPRALNEQPVTNLGDTADSTLKVYVGFRNQ